MLEHENPPGACPNVPVQQVIKVDSKANALGVHAIKVACSNCNLRELCMPMGLTPTELDRIEDVVASRRKIKRGSLLFRNGDKFTSLYAIRTGFFKTCVASEDGRDQVTGFQMAGEVVGLDGIVNDNHTCDAVALEDAEVCVMPFVQGNQFSAAPCAQDHEPRNRTGKRRHAATG